MKVNPFRPVNCRYGAPMGRGRGSTPLTTTKRLCARRGYGIGGYDTGGAYWGLPQNIWAVWNAGEYDTIQYFRASSRDEAIRTAIQEDEA
jgi:hypothetical protein